MFHSQMQVLKCCQPGRIEISVKCINVSYQMQKKGLSSLANIFMNSLTGREIVLSTDAQALCNWSFLNLNISKFHQFTHWDRKLDASMSGVAHAQL